MLGSIAYGLTDFNCCQSGENATKWQSAEAMPLPDWLDPLYDAAEMRAADAWAIDTQGVPSLDLMERAGEGLARVATEAARAGPVRVVVGKGNNGGDGLVVARLLRQDGLEVDVLAAADLDGLQGDALANLQRLPGRPPDPFAADRLEGAGVVVDALLGTGFEGAPREPLAGAIARGRAKGLGRLIHAALRYLELLELKTEVDGHGRREARLN